jgi:hypothetical protein
MRQLIKQEFKKILKKKYFLVLLILLLVFSGYLTYSNYSNVYNGEYAIQDEQGVELTGIDALRYIDSERHKYAGIIDDEFVKKFSNDFDTRVKNIVDNDLTIDEEKMQATYGEDYEQLIERAKEGTLTSEDWDIILNSNTGWYETERENGTSVYLNVFYENQGKLSAVSSIYDYANEYFNTADFIQPWIDKNENTYDPVEYINNSKFAPLLHKEEYLIKICPQNIDENYEYKSFIYIYEEDMENSIDSKIIDYYNQRFMDTKPYYDSTLPNQYLNDNMTHTLVIILALLLIIIVLSDMFSYDCQTKSDQIIACTSYGTKKLKLAKLIVGIATALGIIILQQALIILISNIILPVRDFSLVETSYDTIYSFVTSVNVYIESYGSVFITGIIMLLLGGLVVGMFTMFVSYISKNKFITAIIIILITFFLIFISETGLFDNLINIIFPYIPHNFMRFTIFHRFAYNIGYHNGIVPHTVLFGNVVAVRDLVIIVWLALCVGMGSFISFIKVGEVKSK